MGGGRGGGDSIVIYILRALVLRGRRNTDSFLGCVQSHSGDDEGCCSLTRYGGGGGGDIDKKGNDVFGC